MQNASVHQRLIDQRLFNQRLTEPTFSTPEAVVAWMGAVQAQDYLASLWAVGLRMRAATEAAVEQAYNAGAILRTHVMRPTWHYVTPADIRWMLELTAPRVRVLLAYYDRQLEIDAAEITRSRRVVEQELADGQHRTRPELSAALQSAGIAAGEPQRLGHLLIHLELSAVICSGVRRGKQPTYALIDERAPAAKPLPREEALAELARRYFTSHAPATLKDFAWWSGLTVADARLGMELNAGQFDADEIGGETYWFSGSTPPTSPASVYLLPNYDEYTVAYADRSAIYDPAHNQHLDARGNFLFNHTVVLEGQVVGTWKRTLKKHAVMVELTLFRPLNEAEDQAVTAAARRYGDFLGLDVVIS